MKTLKKKAIIVAFFTASLLLSSLLYGNSLKYKHANANTLPIKPGQVETNLNIDQLAIDGITLDIPTSNAKIDTQTAINAAQNAFPELAVGATDIKVEYHLLTNKSYQLFSKEALDKNPELKAKGHMEKLPAYIVSFRGGSFSMSQPRGYNSSAPEHHEVDVVIDASTGVALMAFSDR